MSKEKNNPFDFLQESGTRHIKVKALNDAEVEIKTSLLVLDEQNIARTQFKNQVVSDTAVIPNQADIILAKIQTVSLILVNPKMSITELSELAGGTDAIDEIYAEFHKHRSSPSRGN